jgi:pSer/pThr/pTyr-binding forkhead associated (FHA) protein
MLGTLVPCGGGVPIPLKKAPLVIGRSSDCDIRISCLTVSSRHCELQHVDGEWWVRDLGSRNGTSVNGTKCERQRVPPNALLAMGAQRYWLSYQPTAVPARPGGGAEDDDARALRILTEDDDAPPVPPPAAQAAPTPVQRGGKLGELVPCGGGDTIPLLRPQLLIGRSSRCDICLRFPSISAKHCSLSLENGYWYVEDLRSSNGTWVDGARCQRKCVMPQSVLGLAKHRFTLRYTATGPAPPDDEAADIFAQSLLEKAGLAKLASEGKLPGGARDDEEQSRRHKLDISDS